MAKKKYGAYEHPDSWVTAAAGKKRGKKGKGKGKRRAKGTIPIAILKKRLAKLSKIVASRS